MIAILKLFLRPKRLFALAFLIACVFWLYNGKALISRTNGSAESATVAKYKQENPKAADYITRAQDRFGQFNTAVALQATEGTYLNSEAMEQAVDLRARLVSLYREDRTNESDFLWSHGMAVDAMSGMQSEADAYLSKLETAKNDQDYWSVVRNDPVALSSELLKTDLALRQQYTDHRNWYISLIKVLVATIGVSDDSRPEEETASFIRLDDLLAVTRNSGPLLRGLVVKPTEAPIEACIYYETFRQFGDVISLTAKEGLPVKETVEVVILNRDNLLTDDEERNGSPVGNPTGVASRLIKLHHDRPSVWAAAQRDGYVLSFDELTPSLAQSVLEEHADLGPASLIVTQYSDVATQAAKIVQRYGQLGIAVLAQYEGSDRFRQLLRSGDVDHRIAMVAVLKADEGLEKALDNPKYVDKWIGDDGDPLKDQWWVGVPLVGGIAKVAVNYADGVPSDWSEIGWAAWDVADVGLMVVSLGTSKVLTSGAKQAIKQTAKRTGKAAAKKMTKSGVKRSSGVAGPTALSRMVSAIRTSKAVAPIRWTSRTIISVVGKGATMGGKLVATSQRIFQTATRIPASVRKWAFRGLLGASLFVRGPERVRILITALNDYAKEIVADAIKAIPQAISDAIEKIKEEANNMIGGNLAALAYLSIAALLGLAAIALFFDVGPRLSIAGGGGGANRGRRG
jgi:hypothetical protein